MIFNPPFARRKNGSFTRRTPGILVVGLSFLATSLPAPSQSEPGRGTPLSLDPDTVKVELSGLFVEDPKKAASRPAQKMEGVSMALQAHGLPSHLVLKMDRVDASLKTQTGEPLPIQSHSRPNPLSSPAVAAVQAALGEARLYATDDLAFDIVPMFSLPRDLVRRHWTDPLRFAATVDLQAAEYRVRDRQPLKTSAFQRDENNAVVLTWDPAAGTPPGVDSAGETVRVLLNPLRKEALFGRPLFTVRPLTSTVSLKGWMFLNEDSPTGTLLTPEWLAGAEVVTMDLHTVASFQRTFVRDPIQLSFDLPGQQGKTSDYNAKALADLTLPRGAGRQQMREYVNAILAISKGQKNFGYEDPQVAMLMKVGPYNLDLLMDAAPTSRTWKDLHIWKAMRELVKEKKTLHPSGPDSRASGKSSRPRGVALVSGLAGGGPSDPPEGTSGRTQRSSRRLDQQHHFLSGPRNLSGPYRPLSSQPHRARTL